MPFSLKNAGATFQRCMDTTFAKQIGRNLEVYIDDLVVNTKEDANHMEDLKEILQQVRQYNMRLNPTKCTFDVQTEKFFGFFANKKWYIS